MFSSLRSHFNFPVKYYQALDACTLLYDNRTPDQPVDFLKGVNHGHNMPQQHLRTAEDGRGTMLVRSPDKL